MKRAEIVRVARTWLGTPFIHQGRVKGVGVDCPGIPLCVAEELGLKDKNGEPMTGRMYHNYTAQPVGTYVHDMCCKHLVRVGLSKMKLGDVVSVNMLTAPCHVAIIGEGKDGLTLIHAYDGGTHKVTEQPLDEKWRRRIAGCFQFPEVED